MGLKWELNYHQEKIDAEKLKENTAFHQMLDLIRSIGGTEEQIDQAIGIWVDGKMASNDEGWHRHARFIVNEKIEEFRSLIDFNEDAEVLK